MSNKLNEWTKAISNMKIRREIYYERDDEEMNQGYMISNVSRHFDSDTDYVNFYSIRTDEPMNYTLEKDEFVKRFKQVIEEH